MIRTHLSNNHVCDVMLWDAAQGASRAVWSFQTSGEQRGDAPKASRPSGLPQKSAGYGVASLAKGHDHSLRLAPCIRRFFAATHHAIIAEMGSKHLVWVVFLLLLAGCGTLGGSSGTKPEPPDRNVSNQKAPAPQTDQSVVKKGGYYLDDGPGDGPQPDFDAIADAVPRYEPLLPRANRPYIAFGISYTPMTEFQPYKAQGVASWYGKRYHGQKTSTGETYDMYGMTAAHPTLPIPSYARVTNPDNGRSVIVRVNDRGPFRSNRLIDLSYAAAYKLRLTGKGSGLVEVEAIDARQPQVSMQNTDKLEKSISSGTFLQVGAFKQKDNADQLRERIVQSGLSQGGAVESWYNEGIHRVRLGPFTSRDEAERAAAQLRQSLGLNAVVTNQ